MNNKLYVGNLAWATNQDSLKQYFSQWGTVTDAFVATDKMSGRSKGFGFVTFTSDDEASKASQAANGQQLDGRAIKVDIARPMEERPARDNRSGGNNNRRERSGSRY